MAGREVVAYCLGPHCVFSDEAVILLRFHGYRARRLQVMLISRVPELARDERLRFLIVLADANVVVASCSVSVRK